MAYVVLVSFLMLIVREVDGLLCPLPVNYAYPGPQTDTAHYVSMCSMCSGNEAAVRWTRFAWTQSGPPVDYRFFQIRYHCSGGTNISLPSYDDDPTDCHWDGYIYPLERNKQKSSHGIVSVGRELKNGTKCDFRLMYGVYVNNAARYHRIIKSCTVGAQCEANNCGIDRVCMFSNGTGEVEEGYCTECNCVEGYHGQACSNIDECEGDNKCHNNAKCHDTDGSYWCGCLPGFQGDGYNCTDIDECQLGEYNCSSNTECQNIAGGYMCECIPGLTSDGNDCTDVDECAGSNMCHERAECHNNHGSYWCKCLAGFQGNGYVCVDDDECQLGTHNCSDYEKCGNVMGSFLCFCKPGFIRDQYHNNCTDINECNEDDNICSETHTICINTVGNYSCDCIDGYRKSNNKCVKSLHPGYILLMVIAALTVTIIPVAVPVLYCLWINRPVTLKFDELAVKNIDPFYHPNFFEGSLSSIKSEYEFLYKSKSNNHHGTCDSGCDPGSTNQSGGFESGSTNQSGGFESGSASQSGGFESGSASQSGGFESESASQSGVFESRSTNQSGGFESRSTNQSGESGLSEDTPPHLHWDMSKEEAPIIMIDFPQLSSTNDDIKTST